MVLCVNSSDAEKTLEILEQHNLEGWKIGEINKGPHQVQLTP